MDSFELNKIAGAVLFAVLVVFGVKELGSAIYHTEEADPQAYAIDVPEEGAPAATEEPEEQGPSLAELLADADPASGEKVAKRCAACHTFEEGGANRIGPNLYGVVGRAIASHEGFSYSDALQGLEGDWTFAKLDHFVEKPSDFAPGTNMAFAGLRKGSDRADLLAYLNSLGSNQPYPEVEAAPAEEASPAAEEAPAEEEAPATEEEAEQAG